ncbi:MAG: allantoinase AllB [Oscillochloris sp.]|nr:allantoinase AllB [Oscillochloris sp.]
MPAYDLIIRGGTVVTPADVAVADLAVADGLIVAVGQNLEGSAAEELPAAGLYVFPALIDAHVHFNEPGRTSWEGWGTGSRALAAGGGALCFEMPLNASPPTIDAAGFALKRAAAEASSLVDFALWGGLVPGDLGRLDELATCGVIGFKAFMSNSGIDDFVAADDLTLYEGMARAARLGLPVAVHAESEALTSALAARARARGRTSSRDYLASRPVLAELEAIGRALLFAEQTGCALHIVHVSSGSGVALVAEARARGVDVTCETCPHYLTLTEEDVERIGAAAKCAPPIRSAADQAHLWVRLLAGQIDLVASDHSPAPPELKGTGVDFFALWGGIAGVQSTLGLLLEEGYHRRGLALAAIAELTSANVARRFRIGPRKGQIAPGSDADLALVDLRTRAPLRREELLDRHRLSPYVARMMGGRVIRTIRRGQTIFAHGRVADGAGGMLITPL